MKNKPLLRTSVRSTKTHTVAHSTQKGAGPHVPGELSGLTLQEGISPSSRSGRSSATSKSVDTVSAEKTLVEKNPSVDQGNRCLFEISSLDGRTLFAIERW